MSRELFSVGMTVAMAEAEGPVKKAPGDLIEKVEAAMRITKDHWLCTIPDERFRAAVGAVMLHYGKDSEEFSRLESEMKGLQKLSVFFSALEAGVQLDAVAWEHQIEEDSDANPRVGLVRIWLQVQKEPK